MKIITRENVIKIARISNIELFEDEIEPLMQRLEAVLGYAQRVKEIAADIHEPSSKNIDVMREDVIIKKDRETFLSLAPERESDYFVVPKILDNN
jgi:aspartyl-tRNA(Asn)/glutamyl-tRNA(Gln) amidotransferase subunit C